LIFDLLEFEIWNFWIAGCLWWCVAS
jgi:hypothetical protein